MEEFFYFSSIPGTPPISHRNRGSYLCHSILPNTLSRALGMLSRKDIDLYLVYITVHLDILGYSIVLPIMASFSESLGGTVDHTTALFSCYAVTQFFSGLSRLALI